MTKSPSLGILVTEPAVTDQPPPPPPAPPTLASLQLLAESLSPTLGSPVSFQVLALGMDGLSLPSTAFSVEVDGVQQTTSQTGPDGTSHFSLTFSQYGNYAVVVKSGSFASNTVSLSIPAPPPPPPTPSAPQTMRTWSAAGLTINLIPGAGSPFDTFALQILGVDNSVGYSVDVVWEGRGGTIGTKAITGGVEAGFQTGGLFGPGNRYGTYSLSVTVIAPAVKTPDGFIPIAPSYYFADAASSLYAGSIAVYNSVVAKTPITDFTVNLPEPTITISDGGQVSAQLNVTTRRISLNVKSSAGPWAGVKVTIFNPSNLSSYGSVTTDKNGDAAIDLTFGKGQTVAIAGFFFHYPLLYPTDVVSNTLAVMF